MTEQTTHIDDNTWDKPKMSAYKWDGKPARQNNVLAVSRAEEITMDTDKTTAEDSAAQRFVMRWPRGKYNGRRIIGVSFKFSLAVDEWRWKPVIGHHCGMFHWLFWRSWLQWEYDHK